MKFRWVGPHDREMLVGWWKKHDFPPPPERYLPQVGIIVDECAAGWLYETGTPLAWVEWVVGDPDCDKLKRRQALGGLLVTLLQIAKTKGITDIFTSSNHPGWIETLKENGFIVADNNVTQLIRRI